MDCKSEQTFKLYCDMSMQYVLFSVVLHVLYKAKELAVHFILF